MHNAKMLVLSTAILVSVWFAATYAAQRDPQRTANSYEVIVGEQKSDMQRMIEAYERLSEQYLVVVQDNLALMANQDRLILEKLTELEKKLDAMALKMESQHPSAGAPQPTKQPAAPDVLY